MVLNKSKYEEEEENFNLEREIQSLSIEKEDETIEYIGSEEDFFAQRIDDTLTIYIGKQTNKIVGVCLSKTSDTLKLAESIYRLSKHIPLNDNSNNIKQDNKNHENGTSNPNTKPCLMCGKQLEPVFKDDGFPASSAGQALLPQEWQHKAGEDFFINLLMGCPRKFFMRK